MKYISIILILIIVTLFVINKDTIISKYSGNNLAYVGGGSASGSGSTSGSVSGQPTGSGSVSVTPGSASGSGTNTNIGSGSGTNVLIKNSLNMVYLGKDLDIYSVRIDNLYQLQEFYSKIKILSNYDSIRFYDDAKLWLLDGARINIYIDKNKNVDSAAIFNGFYVNKIFVVEGSVCKFNGEFKNKTTSFSSINNQFVSKTPKIDSMENGICAPLSAAYSINNVLRLPPPVGMATSTVVNGKRVWNKEYLEWLMKNASVVDGATSAIDVLNFYKMYLSKVTAIMWVNKGLSAEIIKKIERELGLKLKEIDYNKIISDYYDKTKLVDCSMTSVVTKDDGTTMGHISHISNIYTKDGKRYIEITNTLNQGEDQGNSRHNNIPVTQGKTTLILNDAGKLELSHHDSNVSKSNRATWKNILNNEIFEIICVSSDK